MEKKVKNELKVVVVNPPTKKELEKKQKELCAFLSANWHTKINKKP
ncbi:MAG: hypothetical protein IJA67_14135 [Oscillospiraceae bacterium]|nr:hypothetical protein [Oscillospiraceae bacterium]